MRETGWRTRAGLALAVCGGSFLLYLLAFPAPPPQGVEPTYFELHLLGSRLLRIPTTGAHLAAAIRIKHFLLALLPMAGGAFLFFLDTPAGARFANFIRENFGEDGDGA
jgi:hypothetical protein